MILICFGTRPEWLKIKPLIEVLDKDDYKLLFTGQHPDLLKSIDVDYTIEIPKYSPNRLDSIISSCMLQFPNDYEIESILVQGDTGSVFGCALAAFNRELKIYYLESGLRSNNLKHPYPEEGYRQMISRIADVNFCPTKLSKKNLLKENVQGEIQVVGNTVLDNLVESGEGTYDDKVLITLHRRENHHWMRKWFEEINNLAKKYFDLEFILPIHPNPNVIKHEEILTHVNVVPPMNHSDLIEVLKSSKVVITDSGGIQEEGSFFNKKVIVCRKTTERPEGIDTGHLHLCESPNKINELFEILVKNPYITTECPYGDGKASKRIKNLL